MKQLLAVWGALLEMYIIIIIPMVKKECLKGKH